MQIKGSGSSSFISPFNSQVSFKLNNLLHVPAITKNLLSVSQFAKGNSVYFEFHPRLCLVKSQETREILLQGAVGSNGLYSFPHLRLHNSSVSAVSPCKNKAHVQSVPVHSLATVTSVDVPAPAVLSSSSSTLWHTRLGLPNLHVLKLVLNQCKLGSVNKNTFDFCKSCVIGKAHRLPSLIHSTRAISFPSIRPAICT